MPGKSQSVNYWEVVGKVFVSVILGTILATLLALIVNSAIAYSGNERPPDQNAQSTFQAVDTLYTGCFLLPLQLVLLTLFCFLALYFTRFARVSVGKTFAIAGSVEFFVTFLLTWSWRTWLASSFNDNWLVQFEYILLIMWYLFVPLALFFTLLVIPYWRTSGKSDQE